MCIRDRGVVEGAKLGPQGGETRLVLAEKGEGRLDAGIVRLMACQLEVIDVYKRQPVARPMATRFPMFL